MRPDWFIVKCNHLILTVAIWLVNCWTCSVSWHLTTCQSYTRAGTWLAKMWSPDIYCCNMIGQLSMLSEVTLNTPVNQNLKACLVRWHLTSPVNQSLSMFSEIPFIIYPCQWKFVHAKWGDTKNIPVNQSLSKFKANFKHFQWKGAKERRIYIYINLYFFPILWWRTIPQCLFTMFT